MLHFSTCRLFQLRWHLIWIIHRAHYFISFFFTMVNSVLSTLHGSFGNYSVITWYFNYVVFLFSSYLLSVIFWKTHMYVLNVVRKKKLSFCKWKYRCLYIIQICTQLNIKFQLLTMNCYTYYSDVKVYFLIKSPKQFSRIVLIQFKSRYSYWF